MDTGGERHDSGRKASPGQQAEKVGAEETQPDVQVVSRKQAAQAGLLHSAKVAGRLKCHSGRGGGRGPAQARAAEQQHLVRFVSRIPSALPWVLALCSLHNSHN